MIQAIVFDLDDTLFPEHEFVRSGFQAVGAWLWEHYQWPDFFEQAWQIFQQGQRSTIFNQVFDHAQFPYDATLIQTLLTVYRTHCPTIALYPDAEWAIAHFSRHKKMGLITDGYFVSQQQKVQALGLSQWIDPIIYSDTYGRSGWKPNPITYQTLMDQTGYAGSELVYVGDNPTKDFVSAKQLGWLTVRIHRRSGEYSEIAGNDRTKADYTIQSLTELGDLLA